MKIEKLTENKIRVIINTNELDLNFSNINSTTLNDFGNQELFLNILKKAEKEVDFYTDGCKLLIETFSSLEDEDFFVFTITKYVPKNIDKGTTSNKKTNARKKLVVRAKSFNNFDTSTICYFENFEVFCEFCEAINLHRINFKKLINYSTLYLWKNIYFLILKNIDTSSTNCLLLYSKLSEFGKIISYSDSFERKLLEHGDVIMKKNAINTGIKFFC